MNRTNRFAIVVAAAALGTWTLGFWAVPVIALVAGATGTRPLLVSGAAATAWLILMLDDQASGSLLHVATMLAGIMGLPAAALLVLTLVFAALLGWSAASVGDAARSIRSTSRQPS